MKNVLWDAISFIPFLLATENKIKINYTRVIEAIIIAAICGGFTAYVTLNELKIHQGSTVKIMDKLEHRIERIETILLDERK